MSALTWTACLLGGVMLRDVGEACEHVELLGLAVAMATAADVERLLLVATLLLPLSCFSPELCLSISQATRRLSGGKTVIGK